VTLAPALFAVGPRIDVSALELEAGLSTGRRLDEDALALDAPTSLIVGACVGVGARFEAEGGTILVELPNANLDGCLLISGCFFSVDVTYNKPINTEQ